MLYAPSPYSSGTNMSVCEQDMYSAGIPPSPPIAGCSSDAHYSHSTNTAHCTPPTPKEPLEGEELITPVVATAAATTTTTATATTITIAPAIPAGAISEAATQTANDEDNFFFLGQLQNKTSHYHQQRHNDYLLYNEEGYQQTATDGDYYQYHTQQEQQQDGYTVEPYETSYSMPSITDDDFETANRAFHATINKFSRQNYPEHRKRAPYNFLENWHLHSMYSKSQQILLGIPHVRPMVLLSGDDFMFTPPLLQQEEEDDYIDDNDHQLRYLDQSMQMEWMDDGQMFEDGGEMMDDGIVIMSAPDPPLMPIASSSSSSMDSSATVLNENAWMKNQVDSLLQHQYIHSPQSHHSQQHYQPQQYLQPQQHHQQQQQHCQDGCLTSNADDMEPLYFAGGLSSELVHWYRSTDRGRPPSTIMEKSDEEEEEEEEEDDDKEEDQDQDEVEEELEGQEGEYNDSQGDHTSIALHRNDLNDNHAALLNYDSDHGDDDNNMVKTKFRLYIDDDIDDIDDGCDNDNGESVTNQSAADLFLPATKVNGSPTSYQSLADIVTCVPLVSSPSQDQYTQYGSTLKQMSPSSELQQHHHRYHQRLQDEEQSTSKSMSYLQPTWSSQRNMGFTDQIVATLELVMTMASDYRLDGKNSTTAMPFFACLFHIWQVFFLAAGTLLATLWGQPDIMTTDCSTSTTNTTFMVNNKYNRRLTSPVQPLLPF